MSNRVNPLVFEAHFWLQGFITKTGDCAYKMGQRAFKVGVSAKDLEEQGVECDSPSFVPEAPDYLGYILGLMLVWLIYTGYNSAVGAMQEPIAKISEHAETIKETVEVFTTVEQPAVSETSSVEQPLANEPIETEKQSRGWWGKLDLINLGITHAVEYVADSIHSWWVDDAPIDNRPHPVVHKPVAPNSDSSRSEALETF